MAIPLLDVPAQNRPLEQELANAFERVLRSGQFILGPDVSEFESEAAAFLRARHALTISSGTDAILLALMALEIQAGDEVLCPSFTFFATAGCIARVGAIPVFVDADLDTFNLDVTDAEKKVTSRTKAIMPVHLFGQSADMNAVMQLASKHHLEVIEDAAQSFGTLYENQHAGTIGAFGTYSFFPSKNLGGLGDGGMLVTNDDALAERARVLRNHGARPKYYHKYIGGNFRLDTLQAAFLRVKLPRCPSYNEQRRANAAYYNERLSRTPLILPKEKVAGHIWNQYTLRASGPDERDRLRSHLQKNGIGAEIYYPVPLHQQECFRYLHRPGDCPNAALLASQVLSIPIFPELTRVQQDQVISAILQFFDAQ